LSMSLLFLSFQLPWFVPLLVHVFSVSLSFQLPWFVVIYFWTVGVLVILFQYAPANPTVDRER